MFQHLCIRLSAGLLLLTVCATACGQLSRARRAVRPAPAPTPAPAPELPPQPQPSVAAPEPERNRMPPAAVESTPSFSAPQPSPAPQPQRERRAVTFAASQPAAEAAPTPRPTPREGRLARARQQVRPTHSQPAPSPTPAPAPRPQPPNRPRPRPTPPSPAPSPAPSWGRPIRYRGFGVGAFGTHFHHHTMAQPSVCEPVCPDLIVSDVVPPPVVRLCEEPIIVDPPSGERVLPLEPVPAPVLAPPAQRPAFLTPPCWEALDFLPFPYAHGAPGVMSCGTHKTWAGSARFEYGTSFDGLDRRGFGLLVEHTSRLGFDFQWDSFEENLGGGFTDELRLTDLNLMFRVAQNEHYLVRAGIGANILDDAFGTDSGFNVTAKADFFPAEPLVISGEVDLGTIGQAEYFHTAARVGLMLDRFEIFSGYDYRSIGGVALQGTLFGVQVWY